MEFQNQVFFMDSNFSFNWMRVRVGTKSRARLEKKMQKPHDPLLIQFIHLGVVCSWKFQRTSPPFSPLFVFAFFSLVFSTYLCKKVDQLVQAEVLLL